jgi:outer membrane protein assembly factor BamB
VRDYMVGVVAGLVLSFQIFSSQAGAEDWPMLGRDASRNALSPEKNPPLDWKVPVPASPAWKNRPAQEAVGGVNVRWSAEAGTACYATPVIHRGMVWICAAWGTYAGNGKPGGQLRCFRETNGELLYERRSQPLMHRVNDAGWTGIGCSPLIEEDRLWYVTNRWEVVCLDIGPLLRDEGKPHEVWTVDLMKDLGVFPHCFLMGPPRHCSIGPSYGDRIFVTTGNGIDESRIRVQNPSAPALVCLNKNTGKTLWSDSSPGGNVHTSEAASPLVAEIGGRGQVVVPQGDGWMRSFDPLTGAILWQFDMNRKDAVLQLGVRGTRNHCLASPVLYEGRIYVSTGQEAEHGEARGRLLCIDPTKSGDISAELAVDREGEALAPRRIQAVIAADGERAIPNPKSGLIWEFDASKPKFEEQMHGSLSSVVIHKGLVIAPDFSGLVTCLDARTGKWHWSYDQLAACWSNPLIVDDYIYCCEEDGDVAILRLSADPKVALPNGQPVAEINMGDSTYASPVYANGTLYAMARGQLYAISAARTPRAPKALYVPTPQEVVAKMLEVAEVTDKDLVVDLGSGDGRIVIAAAKERGAKGVGYEIDGRLVELSREKVRVAGVEKLVTIHEQDFYAADWSGASVVTAFLYPAVLEKLKPELGRLKPGTRIVTQTFEIPGAAPQGTSTCKVSDSGDEYRIFLYAAPLR